jgi:hypothetical protein
VSKYGFGLLQGARLRRRQLIAFALVSAVVNGIVTALIGGWLARTYTTYQERRQSIEHIASLFYARRTRAGMVVSSLRRNADLQEVRDRKRAYDEAYVDWNTNIRRNLFVIREVMGVSQLSNMEQVFEDTLVAALADMDRCLTQAYDMRMAGQSPLPPLQACRMPETYQYALDCGAAFTNELYKMSQLTFLPLVGASAETRKQAEARVVKDCPKRAAPAPAPAPTPARKPAEPAAATAAQPPAPAPPAATADTPAKPPEAGAGAAETTPAAAPVSPPESPSGR